jgi:hypothetical protein
MQAVPLGFFLFLAELAAGGTVVTVLLDWQGDVNASFLFLNGIFLLGAVAAGLWLRTSVPAARLVPYPTAGSLLNLEPAAWALFALVLAVYLFCVKTDRRAASRVVGGATVAVGLAALSTSAAAYRPPTIAPALVAASFWSGALALGTVWSGMMLGHWYLVTPLLSPRPLLRINGALAGVLAVQGLLAAALIALGAGVAPLSQFWPFWLRVGVGIGFPLLLCVPTWRTARVRSMMSATGLLYIALGAVMAGQIIANVLLFVTQAPV